MTLGRIHAAWREGGLLRAGAMTRAWIEDSVWEAQSGAQTGGLVAIETLIADWQGCHDYYPTGVRTFAHLMAQLDLKADRDVFVDFGCGMGRALLLAAH